MPKDTRLENIAKRVQSGQLIRGMQVGGNQLFTRPGGGSVIKVPLEQIYGAPKSSGQPQARSIPRGPTQQDFTTRDYADPGNLESKWVQEALSGGYGSGITRGVGALGAGVENIPSEQLRSVVGNKGMWGDALKYALLGTFLGGPAVGLISGAMGAGNRIRENRNAVNAQLTGQTPQTPQTGGFFSSIKDNLGSILGGWGSSSNNNSLSSSAFTPDTDTGYDDTFDDMGM